MKRIYTILIEAMDLSVIVIIGLLALPFVAVWEIFLRPNSVAPETDTGSDDRHVCQTCGSILIPDDEKTC